METNQQKIVITGGAGFIGSQLGAFLSVEGFDVVLIDDMSFGHRDNLYSQGKSFGTFIQGDIRSEKLPEWLKNARTVFHFAGISALPVCQSEPYRAFDINTAGTAQVLESCRKAGVQKIIFASTSAVYENGNVEIQQESQNVAPDLVYSQSKYAAEKICLAFANNYKMDISICRFFNVYGPHQDFKRTSPPLTSYIARELAAGRAPVLFNETSVRRDYIYSADVNQLLLRMMKSPKKYHAEVFNVGTGESASVPELYQKMRDCSGKNISAVYKRPDEFWNSYPMLFEGTHPLSRERIVQEVFKSSRADISKVQREFDWSPQISLAQGLAAVYTHALNHSRGIECSAQ